MVWMSHLFIWFITDRLAPGPRLPRGRIIWEQELLRLFHVILLWDCWYGFWPSEASIKDPVLYASIKCHACKYRYVQDTVSWKMPHWLGLRNITKNFYNIFSCRLVWKRGKIQDALRRYTCSYVGHCFPSVLAEWVS